MDDQFAREALNAIKSIIANGGESLLTGVFQPRTDTFLNLVFLFRNGISAKIDMYFDKKACSWAAPRFNFDRAVPAAGSHDVYWHGRDEAGHVVPSGVYYYRLEAGEFTKRSR
ncbi:MAG: hypothetical protein ACI9UK_000380 [Candidatus Krumholzibacteriia bacterium]|jgi:hypothetical protein